MALTKNALIRYRTIDKCLQNRYRKWTLNDLIEACSDALYEYEGKDVNVSKRTIQLDIQNMRSDKMGYNAPIVVYDRKYYTYKDPKYSITNVPITPTDMDILSESVAMLQQFKDFSLFNELQGVISKLEDKVYSEKNQQATIIHLDKNEQLKGLHFLDKIYQSILKQVVLEIEYQSFSAWKSSTLIFTAYILKEFNNRWFAVGRAKGQNKILTLALDRILNLKPLLNHQWRKVDFEPDSYYKDTYGITVLNDKQRLDIELLVNRHNAPYILTKPIHHSQQLLERYEDGRVRIGLRVHHNFEIERYILGFGRGIEVLKPSKLRRRIRFLLEKALENYQENK